MEILPKLTKEGNLTINISDEQRANLTDQQAAFLSVLDEGINAVDADGNSADVNINVVQNDINTVVGGSDSATIDIGDISNIENGEAVTQQSFFAHEVKEQFEMQVGTDGKPVDKYTAHNRAEAVEENITDFERTGIEGNSRFQIIPKSEKKGLSGSGLRFPYKKARTGTTTFIYNNGSKTIRATMHIKNGNVTKIDQRDLILALVIFTSCSVVKTKYHSVDKKACLEYERQLEFIEDYNFYQIDVKHSDLVIAREFLKN